MQVWCEKNFQGTKLKRNSPYYLYLKIVKKCLTRLPMRSSLHSDTCDLVKSVSAFCRKLPVPMFKYYIALK